MIHPIPSPQRKEACAAWLLSSEAAKVLRDPSDRERRERILQNAYSMLQAYDASPGRTSILGLQPRTQDAFDAALSESYPGIEREAAVAAIVVSIRAVAFPEKPGAAIPEPAVAGFFETLRDGLVGLQ